MSYPRLLLLFRIVVLVISCDLPVAAQPCAFTIEKGVSYSMAAERKKIISNLHYNLYFDIPAQKNMPIAARAVISFQLNNTSCPLVLDFKPDTSRIQSVTINGKSVEATSRDEHLVVDQKHLVSGQNTVDIQFIAGNVSLNRKGDYLYCLFVPAKARTVFPCFDQPDMKAIWQLSLTVPSHWKAAGNAPIKEVTTTNNRQNISFAPSDLFSSYLFSFVAGDFKQASKTWSGGSINGYYRESDTNKIANSLDSIFTLHERSLAFMQDYTHYAFPFQKLDFISIPYFQYGGMEHVGAIDYREATLFLDQSATEKSLLERRSVIGHEVAHMWFGDLVTMKWFDDVWLKEVFANFLSDKITGKKGPAYELEFLLSHIPPANHVDRTEGANAIHQQLDNLNEAWAMYGGIIYHKAPVMMRQLELLIGAETLQKGLAQYLKQYEYGNAFWNDLISILDSLSPPDLKKWNEVWVNTPGRPVISYNIKTKGTNIEQLTIQQRGEHRSAYMLPQYFEVALVYEDTILSLPVHMTDELSDVKQARGMKAPLFVLLNANGTGYGLFRVDTAMIKYKKLNDPVMRAAAYISLYENMLDGKSIRPVALLRFFLEALETENESLLFNYLSTSCNAIFWRFLRPETRNNQAASVEAQLWRQFKNAKNLSGNKKELFLTFQNISLTTGALDTLYHIWKDKPDIGIKLSEKDYITMALNLAVKGHQDKNILNTQLARTNNADDQSALKLKIPALSANEQERTNFFTSLAKAENRRNETAVADALRYLHHPLRAESSIRYLDKTLEMFQDVQSTSDIFFPYDWLSNSFSYYQSKEASEIVRSFLKKHPAYNPKFRNTILQTTDMMFRAIKLAE